jgi:crotonobetainyl-CoA:carnitine CoA-transferase CaiB-like acyl-CoA transferase
MRVLPALRLGKHTREALLERDYFEQEIAALIESGAVMETSS